MAVTVSSSSVADGPRDCMRTDRRAVLVSTCTWGVEVKMGREEGGESTSCMTVGRLMTTVTVPGEVWPELSAENTSGGNSSSDEI